MPRISSDWERAATRRPLPAGEDRRGFTPSLCRSRINASCGKAGWHDAQPPISDQAHMACGATGDENRVCPAKLALLGAREPVDKTDAGPSRHHELLLRARVSASPVRSANLVAPGPRRPSPTGRPGRAPGGLGADHGTIRPAEVRVRWCGSAWPPSAGSSVAALPRDGHADAPPGEGLSPARQRRAGARLVLAVKGRPRVATAATTPFFDPQDMRLRA
jgi:hypothetical protein